MKRRNAVLQLLSGFFFFLGLGGRGVQRFRAEGEANGIPPLEDLARFAWSSRYELHIGPLQARHRNFGKRAAINDMQSRSPQNSHKLL